MEYVSHLHITNIAGIKRKSTVRFNFHNHLWILLVRQVFCFCLQLLVIVNTVEVETTEDDLEADQEEDGGGGGVDHAGDSRVRRQDPGQGSHDTQLERLSD